jgi:hypothetical protein
MDPEDHVGHLVLKLINHLVDTPSAVTVESLNENGRTFYRVTVVGREVGMVIGKGGRNARALRTLLAAIAKKEKRQIELDIVRGV